MLALLLFRGGGSHGHVVVFYNGLSLAGGLTHHHHLHRPHITLTPAGGGTYNVVTDNTVTDMKSADVNKETYLIDGALP